jgi:polycomb protein EED
MQFSIPDSEVMFTRFSLFPGTPSGNPILAFCNTGSKVFFWDFDRLEEYYDWVSTQPPELGYQAANNSFSGNISAQETIKRPTFLVPFQRRTRGGGAAGGSAITRLARENSPTESASSNQTGSDGQAGDSEHGGRGEVDNNRGKGKIDWEKSRLLWTEKYEVGNFLEIMEPHKEEVVKGYTFTGRQVGWSADGEWCVCVGSSAVIAVLQRWGK